MCRRQFVNYCVTELKLYVECFCDLTPWRRWKYQRSYFTSDPVSTETGDRLRSDKPPRRVTATQVNSASYLRGQKMSTGQKCGDDLRLQGSKGRMTHSIRG